MMNLKPLTLLICGFFISLLLISGISAEHVYINDTNIDPGKQKTIPVFINVTDTTGLGAATIELYYNSSMVQVNSASNSDFDSLIPNIQNTSGYTRMVAYQFNSSGVGNGTIRFADITLQAVGTAGDSTSLGIKVITLKNNSGHNLAYTISNGTFSINTPPTVKIISPNNGGGGSGGGGGNSGEEFENIICNEVDRQFVNKDQEVGYSFKQDCNYVKHINFTGTASSGKIAAKVEILNHSSSLVDKSAPDVVFKNLNLWVGNMGWFSENNVNDPTITFMVDKTWVNNNHITLALISFYSFNADTMNWEKMYTQQIGEDTRSYYFKASLPMRGILGPMAISGKDSSVIMPTPTSTVTPAQLETPQHAKEQQDDTSKNWQAILLLLVGGGLGLLGYLKKEIIFEWIARRRQ